MSAGRIEATCPLSPMQEAMVLAALYRPGVGVYLQQVIGEFHEDLDLERFHEAWRFVTARHEVFRTSIRTDGSGELMQEVHDHAELPWENHDWRNIDCEEQRNRLSEFLSADRRRGFELEAAPLCRLTVFRMGDRDFTLVWTYHHALLDGRARLEVSREVFLAYEALARGDRPELPAPSAPFRVYAEWTRSRDLREAESFWRDELRGFSSPTPLGGTAAAGSLNGYGEAWLRLSAAETSRLTETAQRLGVTLNSLVQGAWAFVLSRRSSEEDVVFGAARACRHSGPPGSDSMIGVLINTLPVRVRVPDAGSIREWISALRDKWVQLRSREQDPIIEIQNWSELPAGAPLFESLLIFEKHYMVDRAFSERFGDDRRFRFINRMNHPLTLFGFGGDELLFRLEFERSRFEDGDADAILRQLRAALSGIAANDQGDLADLSCLTPGERHQVLEEWNATTVAFTSEACVHAQFEAQAARTPEATALVFKNRSVSYRELNQAADSLAGRLRALGTRPGELVGVCMNRSIEMVTALLAILKAGGAYVPLDPVYPKDRIAFMIEDSRAKLLLAERSLLGSLPKTGSHLVVIEDAIADQGSSIAESNPVSPDDLAYVIYTSGSTGKPKGVMISHRNLANFFTGMDRSVGDEKPGTWLAATSISFDISVLELFWTLARGFKVVLQPEEDHGLSTMVSASASSPGKMDFSLFYFASNAKASTAESYRLLLEGSRFADQHGFSAVWTPERHFHAFGGLFPNPSVTGAAIAAITEHVQIRAGSVVLPLHHPVRVAEEWAVVDNLSHGRVSLSFASGWHANDFVFAPENFERRKQLMLEQLETVRKLWRGESFRGRNGSGDEIEVRVFPRPVQHELPFWLTAAGGPDTFRLAGELGASILTNLLGQSLSELADKILIYREAWQKAGHAGEGRVALMLHTFVGQSTDEVRKKIRPAFCDYLKSSVDLIKASAWSYRALSQVTKKGEQPVFDDETLQLLASQAFDRYFDQSGLFGDVETCLRRVGELRRVGVDEVACLVDFGVDFDSVMASLEFLNTVREQCTGKEDTDGDQSLPAQIRRHGVTHFQCTPSMASILVADSHTAGALKSLHKLLVGGEALLPALACRLCRNVGGKIHNMYGPTETTVWSTTAPVIDDGALSIGRPIANTQIYILDRRRLPVPIGVAGELYIGGEGVARGYLNRPELTAEKFLPDPFRSGGRMYRTGDLARYRRDGSIEFLGRADQQVKIRGHRVELGEIETALAAHAAVRECAVVIREDTPGEAQLVAYAAGKKAGENGVEKNSQWKMIWEKTYSQVGHATDPTFNITGWTSSYTGEPIPVQEMREWVDRTVARILALKPRHALEIGCGSGLLLFRVAPQCERYMGIDFSRVAIASIERELSSHPLPQVELHCQSADELKSLPAASFDTVILNSVAQYFPGIDYAVRVLEQAVRLVAPGGKIFIGDVRNLALHEEFCASIEASRAGKPLSKQELLERVRRRRDREEELLIDPQFFDAVRKRIPQIQEVEILSKDGRFDNELNRFRYDAVLRINGAEAPREPVQIDWTRYANARAAADSDHVSEELREHLRGRLPEHMVPATVILLPSIPRTPNGKLDRRALPPPSKLRTRPARNHVPPGNEIQRKIAEVWCDVLHLDEVGVDDNFFDLGAHSLIVVKANLKLREVLERQIPLVDMFRFPTIAALASHLGGDGSEDKAMKGGLDRGRNRRERLSQRASRRRRRPDEEVGLRS